jgi:Tol biopolymer transport system component
MVQVRTLLLLALATFVGMRAFAGTCVPSTFLPDVYLLGAGQVGVVAVQPLAEALGATVSTQGEGVRVTRGKKSCACAPGSASAQANEQAITLPLAPFADAGVLYAPARPLIEALGGTVDAQWQVSFLRGKQPAMTFPSVAWPGQALHDDQPQLYLVNLDGSGVQRLTYNHGWRFFPTFSADMSQLAYCCGGNLYARDTAKMQTTKLLAGATAQTAYTDARISPDGKLVAYTKSSPTTGDAIGVMHSDGEDVQELGPGHLPQFNSDGDYLLFSAMAPNPLTQKESEAVGTVRLEDRYRQMLTLGHAPTFSPDGKVILYSDVAPDASYAFIYGVGADGSHQTTLAQGTDPVLSHDENTLLFRELSGDLAVTTLLGKKAGSVVQADQTQPVKERDGAFSPDDRQVVFLDENTGLAVMNADRTQRKALTKNTADCRPIFTPDGKRILFLRPRPDAGYDLYTIAPDGSGVAPLLPDLRVQDYQLTPDKQHLMVLAQRD